MNHRLLFALALSCVVSVRAAQFTIGPHNFTLPDGFTIELVADTNLALRPIEADFDEQGRLYVTDSSGSNDKPEKQLVEKPHRVLRLEDTNGDGKFDKTIVFADHMMFPEGAMWHDGSLYVAAPPSIWKLTDTNNDGVADVREEWFQGKTLTGCANDLHGPYLGPDGWIYWCKGAFAKQTYTLANGKEFTTRASHIFRARPDGTGIEPVMTGGMDNPVGLAWSPEGELFLTGTFFQNPAGGKRDGIIHVLYGGVYGKDHDVLDGHIRTGELLPIMTHLGPAAPCGIVRYESDLLGSEFQNNLFVCNFNLHKITRHVIEPNGATYQTRDADFLVSDNTDFHPTDVLEDADGSLIVIDTGGWYKLCCPTSQLYKPDVLGGIYRVRRKSAVKANDPHGLLIAWNSIATSNLVNLLDDYRPAVQKRTMRQLVKRGGDESIYGLSDTLRHHPSARARRNAVWALSQWGSAASIGYIQPGVSDTEPSVVHASLNASSTHQFDNAAEDAQRLLKDGTPAIRRATAELLGRIDLRADWLFEATAHAIGDRALEHSLIYALIQMADVTGARVRLNSTNAAIWRAALIALDQMPGGNLKPEEITPLLSSTNALLKETASWIVSRHPEWGDALASFFSKKLASVSEAQRSEVQSQLEQFARNNSVQALLVKTLSTANTTAQVVALSVLARSGMKVMPDSWLAPVLNALRSRDAGLLVATVSLVRAVPPPKAKADEVNEALIAIAESGEVSLATRMLAAAAVSGGIRKLSEPLYSRLIGTLVREATVTERSDAALALSRAKLSNARMLELAGHLKRVGPMDLPRLLSAFVQSTNEAVGLRLFDSLAVSKAAKSLRPEILKPAITNFPPSVQLRADEFLASLNTDAAQQNKHVDELLASVKGGDIRRGQAIFNSSKTACSSCHAIGYLGGNVGPDLTRIGQIRNERDLIEAVIYPNASFVRSYEPMTVSTKSGDEFNGVLRKDSPEEVVLATGPNTEQRIARSDVAEMRPGTVSVMPSGLVDQLTKEELADLLAFLKATRW